MVKITPEERGAIDTEHGWVWPDRLGLGLPMITAGPTPPSLNRDAMDAAVQYVTYGYVKVLDLGKPEDMTTYQRVANMVASGYADIAVEDRHLVPERNTWLVLLRWYEKYATIPGY